MDPEGIATPPTVADATHATGCVASVLLVEQLTAATGAAAVTDTIPDPEAIPPVTVTFEVNVAAVVYVQECVFSPFVMIVVPSPLQSHAYVVGAGAPFWGVAVAVKRADPPVRTAVGFATTATE
jgi:hypothetical protein